MESLSNTYGISKIKYFLPAKIIDSIDKLSPDTIKKANELRLKTDRPSTITLNGKTCFLCSQGLTQNPSLAIKVAQSDIDAFLYGFCQGSVYSYGSSIQEGFITRFGVRVGLSGDLCMNNAQIKGFSLIDGLNIRLPSHVSGASQVLINHILKNGFTKGKGFLVVSKPGVGKTTLLRDLALRLSTVCTIQGTTKIFRVCVIDERGEIRIGQVFDSSCADFLCGASKDLCINLATRVLSPDIIICDEIGSEKEAQEILKSVFSGIVFIASAHASSIQEVMSKKHIKTLIDSGVFGGICVLSRQNEKVLSELHLIQNKDYD